MSQHIISNTINNNTNSFNNVCNNYTVVDDRSKLLGWLSPLEPRLRHRDVQERRVDKVGEWFMRTEAFRSWYGREGEDEGAVLFCYGDPGVGKTFISSLVVDRLCDQARGQNMAVACFYFDFAARREQSATSVLGSLLKQVVSGMEEVPEEISRAFQEQGRVIGGRGPQFPDIIKMLQTITSSRRTFMCIDALDECVAAHRVKVLDSLKQILEKSPGTRIFVTGRPHIRDEVERRLAGRVISVSVSPSKDDIIRYIRVRLGEDETPDAMDESLEADILEKIPENISEMFLLVSLNIDAILRESTIYRRREKLGKITDGLELGDAYGATIERIKAQNGDKTRLGMAALMWISHAQRPLKADELCHALAVELGSTDFNAYNIPSIPTLVGCCQGLITVDKESSTVRLIHFTLQEYLSAHPNIFSRPHSTMAEICLTYLNSPQVMALSAKLLPDTLDTPFSDTHDTPFPNTENTPFLGYCSVYWGVHAKRELSDCAKSLALKLFQEHYYPIFTYLLLEQVKPLYAEDFDTCFSFSGLHCASFFGIVEVVAALIDTGCYDVNEGDFYDCTPLAWAAGNGHQEVVKMLLARGEADPDKLDSSGQTPLTLAAWNGHEGVVEALLRREDVDPNNPGRFGQTPLTLAAGNGHDGVVKILLEREDVDPNQPGMSGQTPLSLAAGNGHEGVVKILLGLEGVDPDKPGMFGRTPLSLAAWNGHEGVVKILLEQDDVDPDKPDTSGRTPLSFAAEDGHEGVVEILLELEEVSPDKPDTSGRTPLSFAAEDGHEGVVKILLGLEEVSPDKPDTSGRTPLSFAAEGGHEGVVKILLGLEEVNPDKPDNSGRTPLSFAAARSRRRVVTLLQSDKLVNPREWFEV